MPKQIYLLGAGFTKSIYPEAPLNKDLLKTLNNFCKTKVVEKYIKIYQDIHGCIEDIEKLLTYIDMEIGDEDLYNLEPKSKKSELINDRLEINESIAKFFQRFRFKEEVLKRNDWLREFSLKVLQQDDVIINLNYECFLEGILDYLHLWEPVNGYVGVHFYPAAKALATENKNIKIIKVHGSENFVISSCYPDTHMKSIGCLFDETMFPNSARYSHLGGGALDPKSYIIAPSFIKTPHVQITNMMLKAFNEASIAETLIIIGCGLRKEDVFIKFLLTSFLNVKRKDKKKIIIVDPYAEELRNKIGEFWGQNLMSQVCIFNRGFQDSITFLKQKIETEE